MIVPFYNVSQPPACSFFSFISSALKTGLAILPLIFSRLRKDDAGHAGRKLPSCARGDAHVYRILQERPGGAVPLCAGHVASRMREDSTIECTDSPEEKAARVLDVNAAW